MEQIGSFCTGRIVGVEKKQGEMVRKGEIIAFIEQR
jgi:biotin carboxyl carrier protein